MRPARGRHGAPLSLCRHGLINLRLLPSILSAKMRRTIAAPSSLIRISFSPLLPGFDAYPSGSLPVELPRRAMPRSPRCVRMPPLRVRAKSCDQGREGRSPCRRYFTPRHSSHGGVRSEPRSARASPRRPVVRRGAAVARERASASSSCSPRSSRSCPRPRSPTPVRTSSISATTARRRGTSSWGGPRPVKRHSGGSCAAKAASGRAARPSGRSAPAARA